MKKLPPSKSGSWKAALVSMTEGLPRAPWRAPEPPRKSFSGLLVAVVVTLFVLPVAAAIGLVAWGFSVYAHHDPLELIDNPPTIEALERPCAQMTAAADALELHGPPLAQAESLLEFSSAARVVPESVAGFDADLLHDDHPTASWGRDWTALLDSIDAYARSLQSGSATTFTMPLTADGYPIVDRMNWAEPGGCSVPVVLTTLVQSDL